MTGSALTTADVAKVLGLTPRRVRQLAHSGQIPAITTQSGQHIFDSIEVASLAKSRPWLVRKSKKK